MSASEREPDNDRRSSEFHGSKVSFRVGTGHALRCCRRLIDKDAVVLKDDMSGARGAKEIFDFDGRVARQTHITLSRL